ncbi:MAG: hypothetical protein MAG795_00640 [Candidatus Woesearchaeota archaeon]|nr:hypothetical protein [Candidatus Woesearchaeota archaeon]
MIRERFDHLVPASGVGKIFSSLPLSPDFYTVFSVFVAFGGLLCIIYNFTLAGIICFIIAGLMDFIDGAVARYRKVSTTRGAFLDGAVADRLVDFLLVYSFLFIDLPSIIIKIEHLIVVLVYFTLMPTFIVAYANHRNFVDDPDETKIWRIMHRGEMYFLFIVALSVSLFNNVLCSWMLVIITALNITTTIQTIVLSFRNSKD